ncbi:hypothetical protein EIP86_003318 [Pleurotus ostreatoroseus]|nr:hypothetical protein EIP86_003318 [Pleurotus ostreatoroseus]
MAPVNILEEGVGEPSSNAIRVLVTGFGPFWRYTENPSWSAVKPLHNTILHVEPSTDPVFVQNQGLTQTPQHPIIARADQIGAVHLDDHLDDMPVDDADAIPTTPIEVHITTLEIPVTYQAVMSAVPGLHASPPVLPETPEGKPLHPTSPEDGYDFIFHVGVAGRGHLRLEQLAHKHGYRMKDADGQYAPVVPVVKEAPKDPDAEMMETQRAVVPPEGPVAGSAPKPDRMNAPIPVTEIGRPLPVTEIGPPVPVTEIGPPVPVTEIGPPSDLAPGVNRFQIHPRLTGLDPADPDEALFDEAVGVVPPIIETHEHPAVRGYGVGYEQFSDELATEIDVASLIHSMKEFGHSQVYSSMDAGHFLCDFLYFGSLAEAKRLAFNKEKDKLRNTPPRATPVLFMHCPPDGQPLKTEAVTDAIKFIVAWVCRRARP